MSNIVQEIRKRMDEISPGPWKLQSDGSIYSPVGRILNGVRSKRDADFILNAREDIKYLLFQVTALERENNEAAKNTIIFAQKLTAAEAQYHRDIEMIGDLRDRVDRLEEERDSLSEERDSLRHQVTRLECQIEEMHEA